MLSKHMSSMILVFCLLMMLLKALGHLGAGWQFVISGGLR